MKVALINPMAPFLINERVFPNIGLVRVGTQLKEEGHEVQIFDYAGREPEEIREIPNDFDYYSFSSTTPQFPYTMRLFNKLKEQNPDAKTTLGGAHASCLYQLRQKGIDDINIDDLEVFDTIFAGEGEETTNMFEEGWQKANLIRDIDATPIPDRSLIDITSYKYDLLGKPTTSVQTQRGCPYKCTFCCGRDVEMYNRVRTHSTERVLEEMDELHDRYGFDSFMWYDDEINLSMGRLEELCEALSTRPYQHRGFVRSDSIAKHPESVQWMKNAGFVKLCTGVESGSDRILEIINKKTTSEMNLEARRIIGDVGIHYESFLLLGHPSETYEDVAATRQWLKDAQPDDFDINLITPYPGSKIYDDAVPSQRFKSHDWEYNGMYFNKTRYSQKDSFYKGLEGKSESNIRTEQISNEHLKALRNDIETEGRCTK